MDQFAQAIIQKRLETAAKALRANRMDAEILSGPQELLEKLRQLLPPKAIICSGGSMTLKETGVNDLLASGEYDFYYRGRTDENGEPIDVFRKAFSADWYFSSSNAITLNGELYNVDGNANRVAALTFGPEHVVIIAGANKIVPDLEAARQRVRTIAAPANCLRLGIQNGCHQTGHCIDCKAPGHICCTTVIHSFQRIPGRIKVFLLPQEFGY
ncbi:lactate utilization protein [Angelakisella massiliensis]|uniref:lactate utilization protein n=1 Tax=Angelakisella massiliensis TaxID=1871018 RepID=UPI0008F94425|nr:lactate utilization protein [Angelakisella massiliensis]